MAAAAVDTNASAVAVEPSPKDIRLVITASSLGTVFEWYDFFLWGTLTASGILQRSFFPPGNEVLATLLAWATFAVGFAFRPLGAVLFGYFGDVLGRKYTFLITITLMGVATAGIGLVPGYASIGVLAPTLIILFRVVQGMALGGEYGGAAIYVVEHSPPGRAGYLSSFIQASVVGGFILSLVVVLATKALMPAATWADWGWRAPFLFSILLLAVSLWMRLKLSESPVFAAMKAAGETAKNPFLESFTYPGNIRRLFVALFGISAGLTVVWYTAMFTTLSFLQGPMRVEETTAQVIVGVAALAGVAIYLFAGHLSDRVGRKRPIVWGQFATLLLVFPIFWTIGSAANPALDAAARRAPVVVAGPTCRYDVFAAKQSDACGVVLDYLSKRGIAYDKAVAPAVAVSVGGLPVADTSAAGLDAALAGAGYPVGKVVPSPGRIAVILLALLVMMALSAFTYAPVAALLSEMFPPRIRYSSMSIPYHIGAGYFGGFLPLISQYIVARTGDPYAGLWYAWGITALALAVTLFGLREGKPRS
ncbi:MAG: MFS transporter [Pseudomonadota bacterium]